MKTRHLFFRLVASLAVACASCEDAAEPCRDECASGERECSGDGWRECGNQDADPCLDWSQVSPCDPGQICDPQTGRCVEDCVDACPQEGQRRCAPPPDNAYDTCGYHDEDACLEWGGRVSCPDNHACSAGACIPSSAEWFGLGGSEFASYAARTGLGSASGGGISRTAGYSQHPAMVVDPDGRPAVAWHDHSTGGWDVYLRCFDGTAWEELAGSASGGGVSGSGEYARYPSVALDASGRLLVAWEDVSSSGSVEIYLRRFDGTGWEELSGSGSGRGLSRTGGAAHMPSLAVDDGGHPLVAWEDDSSGNHEIYLRRFDGSSWQELGGSATAGGLSDLAGRSLHPALALEPDGNPVVAWEEEYLFDAKIFLRRFTGEEWEELSGSGSGGGVSNPEMDLSWSEEPALALDRDGRPVVCWQEWTTPEEPERERPDIHLRRFDGTGWEELAGSASGGGLSDTEGASLYPALGIDGQGRPVAAWQEQSSWALPPEIFLRRFDGAGWEALSGSASGGGLSRNPGPSEYPALAIDGDDRPVVAWHDESPGVYTSGYSYYHEIFLRRFDGSDWEEVGSPGTKGALSDNPGLSAAPALAFGPDGNPLIAWHDDSGGATQIYLLRFDGSEWEELAGSASGGGLSQTGSWSQYPALAIDGQGKPVVAWRECDSPFNDGCPQVFLRRFDGSDWEELAGSASGDGLSRKAGCSPGRPALALDEDGMPFVAWDDNDYPAPPQIYLRRWNGTGWEEIGGSASGDGISASEGNSLDPALAIDASGRPVVAWQDDSAGNFEIYLRRWNGSAWEELAGSGSGGGLSANEGWSLCPRLALSADGQPVVGWMDDSAGEFALYLRRFDGAGWEELAGSGSGGGISGSQDDANRYAILVRRWQGLAIDPDGRPVAAWEDRSTGQYEIYLRRFDHGMWEELDGSASGGGVSNSGAASFNPVLASCQGLLCAAWSEMGPSSREIVLRCRRQDGAGK
ncbi:MAG: hypothetical protein JXR96_07800 [Deltaproteobacteria bacterium]|nr:hypothetical protein [Deltaproteobacteria bacterium]